LIESWGNIWLCLATIIFDCDVTILSHFWCPNENNLELNARWRKVVVKKVFVVKRSCPKKKREQTALNSCTATSDVDNKVIDHHAMIDDRVGIFLCTTFPSSL